MGARYSDCIELVLVSCSPSCVTLSDCFLLVIHCINKFTGMYAQPYGNTPGAVATSHQRCTLRARHGHDGPVRLVHLPAGPPVGSYGQLYSVPALRLGCLLAACNSPRAQRTPTTQQPTCAQHSNSANERPMINMQGKATSALCTHVGHTAAAHLPFTARRHGVRL